MGITGLIPFLENASSPINIRTIQGSSVAVDSYCWLHKGVFACAEKLARGEKTDIYVNYCLKYIDMLTSNKIKVIMVFDGRHLPAKAETERRRREARNESKRLAKEYLRNNEIEKARSHMRRSIDVTHEMALQLIQACRERGVDCIVAPYEADAQMAWLNKAGLAEYIITEDSDLTLFGAEKILFKLDLNGAALLVEKSKLHLSMGCPAEKYTFDKFRRMCILSGCDYLDSLPGIGLKKACKFMLLTEEDDMTKALKKMPSYLKMKQLEVSEEYIEQFLKAEATFRHMFVYNPLERRMERLFDLQEFETDEKYCSNAGTLQKDNELAYQMALGNINPFTLNQLDNWLPDEDVWPNIVNKNKSNKNYKSIWINYAIKESQTGCMKKTSTRVEASIFRKIEYKNMAELEIKENQAQERLKLDEKDVFSLYSTKTMTVKRKRTYSSDEDPELDEVNDKVDKQITTPCKSLNPFAITHEFNEKNDKLQICQNSSLLKVLSPKKDSVKIDVKSRFFSQTMKQRVKKPFAARDLVGEMAKIEEKSLNNLAIQKTLYMETRVEQIVEHNNNKSDEDLDKTHTSTSKELKEDIILLSGDEDKNYEDLGNNILSSSQKSKSSSLDSLPRRLTHKSGKSTKKSIAMDSKQSTLSMFGFQKRPTLKKL